MKNTNFKKAIQRITTTFSVCILLISSCQSQYIDTLINVGTYKLHFRILQGNRPSIIFESGAGNDASIWKDLLQPLYDSLGATLITYDREGFGQSGYDSNNININQEVSGLETGLYKLEYFENCFFVAHSLGGNYAMTFISRNRTLVKGGVFIDIVTPCFMTEERSKTIKSIYKDNLDTIKKLSPGFYYTLQNYESTSKVMRDAAKTLHAPLTVICSDIPPFHGADSAQWKHCMRSFAAEAPNRLFVLAKKSGHYVFQDNPQLVINLIVEQYKNSVMKKPS